MHQFQSLPYGERQIVFGWSLKEARRVQCAIHDRWPPLRGCRLDILHSGLPPHYRGCVVMADLPHDHFMDVARAYIAADTPSEIGVFVREKLTALLDDFGADTQA